MKVLKVKVSVGGALCNADGIEYEGKLWLVPHWLDMPAQGVTMPSRIIRFDILPHADVRGTNLGDYILNGPMPKELFEPQTPKQAIAGYEYRELPDIRIPLEPEAERRH